MRYLLLLEFLFMAVAPAGNLDRIRRAFEKLEFDKAHELIIKAYEKDPENAGAIYYSALLYSTESFTGFDLDTARVIVNDATKVFNQTDEENVAELEEDGVTQDGIQELSESIRDRIYARVDSDISIEKAESFMTLYPNSPYEERLIFRRDSIVFDQVRKNDQLGVYERFLEKYSTTEFREIAIKRIDELRYQVLTYSGSLPDYYQFLDDYPTTKFRSEIERYILRNATIDHKENSYRDFIRFAQDDQLKKKAADILYYVDPEDPFIANHPRQDSITAIYKTRDLKLITAMENGEFGFHSRYGSLQIPYSFDDVGYDHKCGLTEGDWLIVKNEIKNQIINKNGEVVIAELDDYEDLTYGAALVDTKNGTFLYHKSGFKILDTAIDDAEVLAGRWIRVKRDGKWALVSFSGNLITNFEFSDIRLEGKFWMFEKDQLLAVYTEDLIEEDLHEEGLDLEYKFEDLELVAENMLIGFRDNRECMLDDELNFLVPWGVYEINPDESGWYLKTADGYRLYNHSEQDIMNQVHPYLETNAGWLALKTNEDWMLIARSQNVEPSRGYDSLKLLNDFCALTVAEEESKLIFSNAEERTVTDQKVRSFFNQPNYLLIEEEESKIIIDSAGLEKVKGTFEEVTFFNDTLLKVKSKGKNGLMKLDGTYLLDLEYDAIDEENDLILSLKDGLIGCLDLENEITISPNYESRIERIGKNYLVKQRGKFGLVNALEDSVLSFSYDEIRFWNDTSFLVRNETEWNFVNWTEEIVDEPVEFLSEVLSRDDEIIMKYVRDGKYGLLSNRNGFILSPEFTDIFNVGSEEEPIFFADQHLDKAGFHVVSYLNRAGELLLSKAYKRNEFDKILCDDEL